MGSQRQKRRTRCPERRVHHHKRSVLAISAVILLLGTVVIMHGASLEKKNRLYMAQEAELKRQIDDEKKRSEEIDKLKEYIETDEYIEEMAREKLGLVKENENLLRPEQ